MLFIVSCNQNRNLNIITKIKEYRSHILSTCKIYSIKPEIFASIVFGELKNNYDFFDSFDSFRAEIGDDPSVGFSQIKVSTFKWIEKNRLDSDSYLKPSVSYNDLLNKIENDSVNIRYAAYYISLISEKLKAKLRSEPPVGLIASYYSRGIDYGKQITSTTYINQVGITADSIYMSGVFQKIFLK